ncbi:MAG: hypothetical protein ABWZ25_05390 [Chitinophagaceae bacterium]
MKTNAATLPTPGLLIEDIFSIDYAACSLSGIFSAGPGLTLLIAYLFSIDHAAGS